MVMFTRVFSVVLAAGPALVIALPSAQAADEIEAKTKACAACHGKKGVPANPKTMPVIWGQQESYLMKQLRDFRNGARASAVMSPIAKDLAEGDLRKIAAYFAAKPWPKRAPAKGAAKGASAKSASAKAPPSPPQGIAQCQSCHQPDFQGGMPAPRLAGLSSEYLVASMRAFAKGQRTNNLDMPGFMRALSEAERAAMARYISAL